MQSYDSLPKIFKNNAVTAISVAVFCIVAIGNLICSNTLSTKGGSVNLSELEIFKLEKENQQIAVKVEELSNLNKLESYAKINGFVRVNKIVFAPTPATVALR